VPRQRQGERTFGLVAGETGRRVEHSLQGVTLRQVFGLVARQFAGDAKKLLSIRKLMLQDHEHLSNSTGSCTTGDSTTRNVRCCLPATNCENVV